MPIHREESDLSAVIAEALDTISNLWRRSDLQLRAELPPLIPALQFDRTRIRQVLINLLTNAARFTAQGAITVSVQVAEREVIVAVTDTGVGIPPDELARIFDEFHQVDRSLRKAQEGAGLGLAICRRFVELHGGRIWAESEVGQGSTLFFALPRTTDAVAARLIRTKALRPQRAGQPTVILVEEDPGVGALLMRYLERYQVLQVPNLGDAATLAREVYPHALVVNLPPGDQAMATAHQTIVEAMPDEIPVVCCSIPSQSWIAGSAQAQGCLTKPFSRQELMRHLQSFPDAQHILIVDDDMGFVQLVERYLDSAATQYTTHWAQDGLQALEQIHITPPDLILLDLMMPRMDGFGFLRALHSEEGLAHIPVLITTASDYTPGLLEQKSSAITLMRRTALQPMETVNYLRAILGLGEAGPLVESAPVPSVAASG
jgi:CheY-like chemotaxis protein